MCGIAGMLSLNGAPIPDLDRKLRVMNHLLVHRGPDGSGTWQHPRGHLGFAHRRLSIIDVAGGAQPMLAPSGSAITYNGEVYNYRELRAELASGFSFKTQSDTEAILAALQAFGQDALGHLRGMFAFAYWDEQSATLYCVRDRFGIKPLYYTIVNGIFYFASEAKALLPFLDSIETDLEALQDYLAFQFCLSGKTLFSGIRELLPAHELAIRAGSVTSRRYWEVQYEVDFDHTPKYFVERVSELLRDSVSMHMRSDVPVGAYVSGGIDSSLVASLASVEPSGTFLGFTGRFGEPGYDESPYARDVAKNRGFELFDVEIKLSDFTRDISDVIYHLDYPVAGPGSFPQFEVSRLASQQRKVLLGGQGGDEIFGGYARYLIAYFEQCIKGAIDGNLREGNFVVTYESIIPNLVTLKGYKPMIQSFFQKGLFEPMDQRYFQLINRATDLGDEVRAADLPPYSAFESFQSVFHSNNVKKESYFDLMTHFDFKTLLPALLQVEDRVSMAHGLESRVPLLDHPLIEFAATIPADVKFKNGAMKQVLRQVAAKELPTSVLERKDKMGFPVPLSEWLAGELNGFVRDIFQSKAAQHRAVIDNKKVAAKITSEPRYGRKIWGFLCLELWQQRFHDQHWRFKELLTKGELS